MTENELQQQQLPSGEQSEPLDGAKRHPPAKKWRLSKVKSVRVSPELLQMLELEISKRKMSLSQYCRHSMILGLKHANKKPKKAA